MSKNTISFDNFADWHGEVSGVEFRSYMPLPEYVPTSELDVNLARIARLARIGRLASVQFGLYDEDSEVSFAVGSMNADGSSTATAIKAGSVPRAKSKVDQPPMNEKYVFPPGHGQVRVNVAHPDLDDQVLREAKPWASLLDKGISDGLYNAGKQQMTNPRSRRCKGIGVFWGMYITLGAGVTLLTQDIYAALIVPGCAAVHGIMYPQIDKAMGNRQLAESSVLPFWPQDRILVLRALAKTQSIVTVK